MPDFSKGRIYQVYNDIDDDIYVGSTCRPICQRLAWHKYNRNSAKCKSKLQVKMNEVGPEHFYIELVEEFPCDNIEQLRQREGHFIRLMGTLNQVIAGRKKAEYDRDNADKIKEYKIANKEHILAQSKEYYTRTKDHQSERQRSDKVKQWKTIKVECRCGGTYSLCNKAQHYKCAKHQAHELTLNSL